MNTNQIAKLNQVRNADRRSQIEVLKQVRSEGVKLLTKLTASAKAIASEVERLLTMAAEATSGAVKARVMEVKAVMAYWANTHVKAPNLRAVRGAIALSQKLGF